MNKCLLNATTLSLASSVSRFLHMVYQCFNRNQSLLSLSLIAMLDNTILFPGKGIGNTLRLGKSLYTTIKALDKFGYKMKIIYSGKDYLNTPVMILLPEIGVRLVFSSLKLVLIEILDLQKLKLSYNNKVLNPLVHDENNNELLTLKTVYNKIFGPTYPGTLQGEDYILSYNGISFKFHINLKVLVTKVSRFAGDEDKILSTLLNSSYPDVTCTAISVHSGDSWSEVAPALVADPVVAVTSIRKLQIDVKEGVVKVLFDDRDHIINIGRTTQQEILNLFGPPDDYFNKFDSRFLIHNHLSKSLGIDIHDNSLYKFHNYFSLGLDFLYDLTPRGIGTGVLRKIVIHNGQIPESLDFMRWNKCNWEMFENFKEEPRATSDMYFRDIPEDFLATINANDSVRPVILNRNESEFIDNDIDIIKANDLGDDSDSAISSKAKTWGHSKLYGCERCIWEVVDSNGCISCLTVF